MSSPALRLRWTSLQSMQRWTRPTRPHLGQLCRLVPSMTRTPRPGRRGHRRRRGCSKGSSDSGCGAWCPVFQLARRAGSDGSGTTLHRDGGRADESVGSTTQYLRKSKQDRTVGPDKLRAERRLAWRLAYLPARRDTMTSRTTVIGHHLSWVSSGRPMAASRIRHPVLPRCQPNYPDGV